MIGQLGQSKNSRGHLKLILCCSLPDVIPHIQFHLNWMKNNDFQIFEIFDLQNFFENSAKAKLSKLEPFAWSYWIRNCLNYFQCQCQHQPHNVHKMAQLTQTSTSENWKSRFSSMSQKSKIAFDFFLIMPQLQHSNFHSRELPNSYGIVFRI